MLTNHKAQQRICIDLLPFQAVIINTDDYGLYRFEYKISGTLSADRKSITAINLSTLDSGPGYSHTRTLKAKNLPLDSKTKSNDSYSYYLEGTDLAASITEATFNPKFMTPYYPNSNCVYSGVDYTVKASLRVNLEKAKSSTKELFEK